MILLILIANAFVGVYQEKQADNALEALKKLQPAEAQALRNGVWAKIDAGDLVPGDILELRYQFVFFILPLCAFFFLIWKLRAFSTIRV